MTTLPEIPDCKRCRKVQRFFTAFSGHGFSIIEVMVAMIIMVIGILAAAQMEILSQRNVTSGNVVTSALLIAHAEIEKISSIRDITGLKQSFVRDPESRDLFRVSYTFADLLAEDMDQPYHANCETGNYDGSGSCVAVVTVSWKRGSGGRGGEGSVQLKTMVHNGRI